MSLRRKVAGSTTSDAAPTIARLENMLDLAHGGFYEAFRLLSKAEGGCVHKAMQELARFLTPEELEALRVKRKPCP